jgi:hypothetical protein
MDIYIIQDWEQTVSVEPDQVTAVGPFNKWEIIVGHPIEQRQYTIDLKQLDTHWRMRVFWSSIREGHRWMKALHPTNQYDVKEAKFLAMKHLNRYFEEQLALYNAVCIIHMGQKYSDECNCNDCDHSQHLRTEQQPLLEYAGGGMPRRFEKLNEDEVCDMCIGKVDIERYLKHNLCPYCFTVLPKSFEEYEEIVGKMGEDFKEEYKAKIRTAKGKSRTGGGND